MNTSKSDRDFWLDRSTASLNGERLSEADFAQLRQIAGLDDMRDGMASRSNITVWFRRRDAIKVAGLSSRVLA